jgi:hypothetical protein
VGKHAQYRKRGSCPSGNPYLTAPPPPLLQHTGNTITATAMGGNDIGGSLDFWISYDHGASWQQDIGGPWAQIQGFDVANWQPGNRIRLVETGNGVDYVGRSTSSNEIQL